MRAPTNLKIYISIFLLFLFHVCVFSQNVKPRIEKYALENGLSQSTVLSLLKDSSDFIWIGTQDGLNRFDGQQFRHFRPSTEDTTAITSSFITTLLEVDNGNIWIGTLDGGLCFYDSKSEIFHKVPLKSEKKASITCLEIEENGVIWVGTRKSGVQRLQPLGKNKFKIDDFLSTIEITSLFIDDEKKLWIGGLEGTIYTFDLSTNNTKSKSLQLNVQGNIRAYYKTEKDLLIGTEMGFYSYDLSTENVKRINLDQQTEGSVKQVSDILYAGSSTVWVGTDSGLFLYDYEYEKVLNKIDYVENNTHGITNNKVSTILQNSENQLFVGTASGLNLVDFDNPYFKNISKNKRGEHLLNDNGIYAILKDDAHTWVGTYQGGLNLITNEKTYYFKEDRSNLNSITGNEVRDILKDTKNQRLWIATSRGLNMIDLTSFNPNKPIFKTFTYDQKNTNSISSNFLKSITLDTNNNVWGATYGQGIFRLQLDNDNKTSIVRFKNKKNNPNSLSNDFVEKIMADPDNTIWAGTQGGVSRLSFTDNALTKPIFNNNGIHKNTRNATKPTAILDIAIDSKGNKWLATNTGLGLYLGENKFKFWENQELNLSGLIYSVQHDDDGNLWMGTSAGVIRYNPSTEDFKTYSIEDGIQSEEFEMHAKFKDEEGTVYLGGVAGYTYFNPKDLEGIDIPEALYFSQLRVKDEVITPRNSTNYKLNASINSTSDLEFNHDEFPFFLQFSSVDFRINKHVEFGYKLLPNDREWNMLKEPEIQFLNLPSGYHTLLVNGFSRGKEWNQVPMKMNLTILPPWWATWWAYVGYLAIAAALSNYFYRFKVSRKLAVAESIRLKEVSALKSGLYTNITHEFRTPLTVILGMTQNLKKNLKSTISIADENSLDMIERNGESLLEMVNEMLDLAKVDSNSMELHLIQTDVIPFVKYLSESFHSLAESKNVNLTVYSEVDALEMDIDVNKVASIISNLLSNAIKFTKNTGKIVVHLNKTDQNENEFFTIKVKDNGIGLANEDIGHLFDRFYQVNNTSTKQEGTGIGLSLAKEFVELMNGTIEVGSTLGKGSTFTVQIPVTNKAAKTVDAKITVEPPIKKTAPSAKTKPSIFDEASTLPLALIIEDNEDVAHYLKTCLKGKYQTIHASNGNMGIEMAYEKIPDIIISDVMMPGKDGFEVCTTLKADERTNHIPIILLTAKVTTEDRLTGLSRGADAYLAKPFNEKELFIRLNQLVLLRKKLIDKIQKDGLNKFLDKQADSPETKFLQKVIQFINEDISNSTFGSGDLADKLHLSESQIYRKLKAITDKSTAVFIRSIRLQKAKELIETTDKTISEIAYETGFNDPSWFSRAFKEEFGVAPSDVHK